MSATGIANGAGSGVDDSTREVWWIRWSCIAASHVVASSVAAIYLFVLPAKICVLPYVVAAVTNGDMGGWLFAVGVMLIVVLGVACSLAVCAAGLVVDVVRRAMRLPMWVSPILVLVVTFGAALWSFRTGTLDTDGATTKAVLLALLSTAIFGMHWIPLSASGVGVRWLNRRATSAYWQSRARRETARASTVQPLA